MRTLPSHVRASRSGLRLAAVLVVFCSAACAAPTGPAASNVEPASSSHPGASGVAKITKARGITARLVLRRTVVPAGGGPLRGYVEIVNSTASPVVVPDACNGIVQVYLAAQHSEGGFASGLVACASKTLPVGTTRLPVVVPTAYRECRQGSASQAPGMVPCGGRRHNVMPPLPAGTYVANTFFTRTAPQLRAPAGVRISLTPNR